MARTTYLIAAALLAVAACGGSDSAGPEEQPDPQVVGSTGGRVVAANGNVAFTVPAGAVAGDIRLTATPITDPTASDKTVSGSIYEFGPTGTQFATPITVALKYTNGNLPAGTSPQDLTVSRFENGAWVPLTTPVTVDPATNEVRAQLTSFSRYAITEKKCSYRTLSLGESRQGELTADDCVFNTADGRRFDLYRFTLTSRQFVSWNSTGTVTGGHGIYTPGSNPPTAWAALGRGSEQTALLDPGTYSVYVRGNDATSIGAYTFSLNSVSTTFPAPPRSSCSSVLMAPGSVTGRYELGDCAITTTFAQPPFLPTDQTSADYYVFRPESSSTYRITLTSSAEGYVAFYVYALQAAPLRIDGVSAGGGTVTYTFTTPNPGDAFHYFEIGGTPRANRADVTPGNYTFTITKL